MIRTLFILDIVDYRSSTMRPDDQAHNCLENSPFLFEKTIKIDEKCNAWNSK